MYFKMEEEICFSSKHPSSKQTQARRSAVCRKQQMEHYWMAELFLNIS